MYFSTACPSAGPESFCLWRRCSSALSGLQGCPGWWHRVTSGCHRSRGWSNLWLQAAGSVHAPSRTLSPFVIFYRLCFVWPLSVLQALVEAIDWLWLLPMDGLQKGNGKINRFSPLGLAEVVNTCRTAVSCDLPADGWLSPQRSFLCFLPAFLKFKMGMCVPAVDWTRFQLDWLAMVETNSHPKPGSIVSEMFANTIGFVCAASGTESGGEWLWHCHPHQQRCPGGGPCAQLSQSPSQTETLQ